jgi:hypothetical protein
MNARSIAFVVAALAAASFPAAALDGREIMQNVDAVKKPRFSHSAVKMELVDKTGGVEVRQIEEWGKNENDLTSVVMAFHTPASVKDTRFLQVENKDKADDKWIYLPALRSVRRVASSEGDKSFMGTDATYDDMSTREVDQDTHELLGEKTVAGFDCWTVKSTATDPADSQYAHRITYVDKKTSVPVRVEMFDKKDSALLKVLEVEKLENVGGYWITRATSLSNVKTGHSTRITLMKIEVDKQVSPKLFTPAFLSTGRL